MTNNLIAFEVTLATSYAPLSATRLIGDVTIYNQSAANYCLISSDGGATKSTLWTRAAITLQGVNLAEIWVASNVAGTIISVTGTSRNR